MKYTRVYNDVNGDSHFEEVEVPLTDRGKVGRLSEPIQASDVMFRENEPS